MLKRSHLIIN